MKIREIDWSKIPTDSAHAHKVALEGYAEEAIRVVGNNHLAIEVGSNYGASAAALCGYFEMVVCVDAWYRKLGSNKYDLNQLDFGRLTGFYDTVKRYKLNVIPVLSTSDALVHLGIEASLVFIDGEHSAEGVTLDIENTDRCLMTGGLMALHDYHKSWNEVVLAVDGSKILKEKYRVFEKREDGMICFRKEKT